MPDRTRPSSAGECLDPEVLSAYVDKTLQPDERATVEAHLARCEDCYDLLSEVLRIQEEVSAARPARDAPLDVMSPPDRRPSRDTVERGAFGRRKVAWGVAAVLASAAAVVLMVRVLPSQWTSDVDPKLADLVEAVGVERTIEARLTGGFKYGPLRSPVRSGGGAGPTGNLLLLAAVGRIRENAEASPTPENVHASGVAALLIGDADAAVRALDRAMSLDSMRPEIVNSLAAAYLSKYTSHGDPEDLRRALEFVERALTADPDMPEALFNRALVVESTSGGAAAVRAWEAYLRVDARSPWADEARTHLEALQTSRGDR